MKLLISIYEIASLGKLNELYKLLPDLRTKPDSYIIELDMNQVRKVEIIQDIIDECWEN